MSASSVECECGACPFGSCPNTCYMSLVAKAPQSLRSPTDLLLLVSGSLLPVDSQARKDTPIYSGVLKYFPLALAEVARLSKAGNDKHNPGEPLHWSRGKSNDHADCIARHLVELGTIDPDDGHRHATKLAWRALAALQLELEGAQKDGEKSA